MPQVSLPNMSQPPEIYKVVENIVGPVTWVGDGDHGLCECPGKWQHTGRDAKTDTTIFLSGAPTIYCFHASCGASVAAANLRLRRALGPTWELILPGGGFLRSGENVIPAGQPVPPRAPVPASGSLQEEQRLRDAIRLQVQVLKPRLLETFRWDPADMWEESPVRLSENHEDDWKLWLELWKAEDVIWCGDTYDSGQEHHKNNFCTPADWNLRRPAGNFTCGSAFQPGTFSRKNEHTVRRFMVIESDTLTKPEMGAIFRWMICKMGYKLQCVVDTGGKSIHGWFNLPPCALFEERLKVALTALGCDPALFKPSQPVRVPGIERTPGTWQTLLWIRSPHTTLSAVSPT